MTISTVAGLPSAETAPRGAKRSEVRARILRASPNRRTVLRSILVAGMALGVASLDLLPGRSPAHAVPPTRHDCNYPDSWKIDCNEGPTRVSTQYCNGPGWHRTDGFANACESRNYMRRRRCGARPGGGNYNAWVWRRGTSGPATKRCSDGRIVGVRKTPCHPEQVEYGFKSACIRLL